MDFDLNQIANLANIFGKMSNVGGANGQARQNSPQNAEKQRDRRTSVKTHGLSPFAAQNGLGEQIDVSSFDASVKNNAQSASAGTDGSHMGAGAEGGNAKSPLENLMSLMSKKKDFEKMMPAFANIFSQKQSKTAEERRSNTQSDNAKAQTTKENGKPKDLFSPIEFAGYTLLSAFNRLYYALKTCSKFNVH